MDEGSGSGIFPDPDPGDPKRPDPTRIRNNEVKIVDTLIQDHPNAKCKM